MVLLLLLLVFWGLAISVECVKVWVRFDFVVVVGVGCVGCFAYGCWCDFGLFYSCQTP